MRVVYSRLTDAEAAVRIGEVVRSDLRGAEATLRYVRRVQDLSRGYATDRACRILVGAIVGTAPEPIRPEDVDLFERERELGWMPLGQAFERLRLAVPQLESIRTRAEQLGISPEAFGIRHDTERDDRVIPAGVLATADRLVGPDSAHLDPLIRSSVAAAVVANYVTAVIIRTTDRALWEYDKPKPKVRVTGSFFG